MITHMEITEMESNHVYLSNWLCECPHLIFYNGIGRDMYRYESLRDYRNKVLPHVLHVLLYNAKNMIGFRLNSNMRIHLRWSAEQQENPSVLSFSFSFFLPFLVTWQSLILLLILLLFLNVEILFYGQGLQHQKFRVYISLISALS